MASCDGRPIPVGEEEEEAVGLGHNYLGTEHLLLGLIREQEGIAAEVLDNIGVGIEAARTEVRNLVGSQELEDNDQDG